MQSIKISGAARAAAGIASRSAAAALRALATGVGLVAILCVGTLVALYGMPLLNIAFNTLRVSVIGH